MGNEAEELIEAEKVSIKDMYDRISRCRDFEISNVWKRAVFLTAFLIGCFTAYGFIVIKIGDTRPVFSNWAAFAITLMGMAVSTIWVLMAKASKAWYEIYEDIIDNFVSVFPRGFDSRNKEEKLLYECKLKDLRKVLEGDPKWKHFGVHINKTSQRLWSTDGGAYSPSRVNIVIGQLSFVLWVVLSFFHTVLAFRVLGMEKCIVFMSNAVRWLREYNCFLMLAISFFAVVFLVCILPRWVETRKQR